MDTNGVWRPPQWSKPATVMITVPVQHQATGGAGNDTGQQTETGLTVIQGVGTVSNLYPKSYVFDAVLALDHDQTVTKTRHPVQTGSAISSHAYIEPAVLIMYVLMSDAAGSFNNGVNQTTEPYIQAWVGNSSKSVSAYQQMITLQAQRIPLTVTTRLRTYQNMIITRVTPREDDKTVAGARFRLEFEQVFIADTQLVTVSTRPNDTESTGLGAVNVQTPTQAINNQFSVDDNNIPTSSSTSQANMAEWLDNNPQGVNVPGAGTFSSVNVNNLQQLPSPR